MQHPAALNTIFAAQNCGPYLVSVVCFAVQSATATAELLATVDPLAAAIIR